MKKVLRTLDQLALNLAGHKWTPKERLNYEQSVEIVSRIIRTKISLEKEWICIRDGGIEKKYPMESGLGFFIYDITELLAGKEIKFIEKETEK